MEKQKAGFDSIDEYIATFPEHIQKLLEKVRATIRTAAPDAQEKISYGIPTFTLHGKYLIYFAGWKKHISIYPIPSGTEAFNIKIAEYVTGKGTLKFPTGQPLPLELITEIVKLSVTENIKNAGTKSNQKK